MVYSPQTRKSTTLQTTMTAGATSCTLASAVFGTPTDQQIITIDGNNASKAADFICTIVGTAITSMTLCSGSPDVEHSAGAPVWMGMVKEHYDALTNGTGIDDGAIAYVKLLSTIFSGQVTTGTNAGAEGGAIHSLNLGGIKLCWGTTNAKAINASVVTVAVTFPVGFFSGTPQAVIGIGQAGTSGQRIACYNDTLSSAAARFVLWDTTGGTTNSAKVSYFAIGT